VVLCRPGVTDSFIWDQKRASQHGFVHFDVAAVPAEWPAAEQWPTVRMLTAEDVYPTLFRHLLTHVASGPAWLTRLTLAELLAVVVTGCTAATPLSASGLSEPVQSAIDLIHRRLEEDATQPITLEDMASVACVTPEHLCRLFKRDTGRTPLETARLARLDLAATRLVRSNEPVGRVAESCGFASPFHFSRRFSEAFGLSPSAVRRQVRMGQTPPLPRLLSIRLR
jgi:AraC-like DNA-binding protein